MKFTKDGSAKAYQHGVAKHFIEDWQNILLSNNDYELLSDEDMEEYFSELEDSQETKK